jgi:hypothetical protein
VPVNNSITTSAPAAIHQKSPLAAMPVSKRKHPGISGVFIARQPSRKGYREAAM